MKGGDTAIRQSRSRILEGREGGDDERESRALQGRDHRVAWTALPAGSVEKRTRVNSSGMCESHTPCGLQAQPPGSFAGGASLYWLNREKSMRHSSPSRGGSARRSGIARGSSERHG